MTGLLRSACRDRPPVLLRYGPDAGPEKLPGQHPLNHAQPVRYAASLTAQAGRCGGLDCGCSSARFGRQRSGGGGGSRRDRPQGGRDVLEPLLHPCDQMQQRPPERLVIILCDRGRDRCPRPATPRQGKPARAAPSSSTLDACAPRPALLLNRTLRSDRHRSDRHSGPVERSAWPRSGRVERDLPGAGPVVFPGLHLVPSTIVPADDQDGPSEVDGSLGITDQGGSPQHGISAPVHVRRIECDRQPAARQGAGPGRACATGAGDRAPGRPSVYLRNLPIHGHVRGRASLGFLPPSGGSGAPEIPPPFLVLSRRQAPRSVPIPRAVRRLFKPFRPSFLTFGSQIQKGVAVKRSNGAENA